MRDDELLLAPAYAMPYVVTLSHRRASALIAMNNIGDIDYVIHYASSKATPAR